MQGKKKIISADLFDKMYFYSIKSIIFKEFYKSSEFYTVKVEHVFYALNSNFLS